MAKRSLEAAALLSWQSVACVSKEETAVWVTGSANFLAFCKEL